MSRKHKTEKPQLSPRVFVCWVCGRDYPLIPLHYAAIRKLTNDAVLYVWDKTEKDAQPPNAPRGAITIGSEFERAGNLNGQNCIAAMMDFYIKLGAMGVENIVKVDADTVLTALDWISAGTNSGFHCANGYAWTGCAYSLTMPTVTGIHEYLRGHDISPRDGYTLPEDATITMLAALARKDEVKILENGEHVCGGFTHAMRNNPAAVRKIKGVLHCGQWQRVDALTGLGLSRVDIVRGDMEFALSALYGDGNARAPLYSRIPEHSFIAMKKEKAPN